MKIAESSEDIDYIVGDNEISDYPMVADGGNRQRKDPLLERLKQIKVNDEITHKMHGAGRVTKISKDRKYITIAFGKLEKTFVFYAAFKKGLLK